MQPYQEAAEATKQQSLAPFKLAKNIAKTGLGIATGAGLAGKVLPFLSKYIPSDLALKGIAKVNPRLGKFANQAVEAGYPIDETLGFIRGKIESQEQPKENRNIIQQYSPELHSFIEQEIKRGRSPIQAGALAQNDKRFKTAISKLSKDHKTNWSQIIQGIYGTGETAQPQQQAQQSQQPPQASTPGQPPQQGAGQGQQALMGLIQQYMQSRGQR